MRRARRRSWQTRTSRAAAFPEAVRAERAQQEKIVGLQLEIRLANGMLKGEISDGDTVRLFYDGARGVRWEEKGEAAASPVRERGGEAHPTAH